MSHTIAVGLLPEALLKPIKPAVCDVPAFERALEEPKPYNW
jgi:hypothetical protein